MGRKDNRVEEGDVCIRGRSGRWKEEGVREIKESEKA